MKYTAEFKIAITVSFDDDGVHDIRDQAFNALWDISIDQNNADDVELLGVPTVVSGLPA